MKREDCKILIVDDEPISQRLSKHKLQVLNFQNIIEAVSAESALEKLKTEKVDLIMADWRMDPMTGIDFFKALKKDDVLKDIPFILLTAVNDKDFITQAFREGIKNYIIKPLEEEPLSEKLTRLLKLEN